MSPADIKLIQREIGTTTDGIWGPKSKAAAKAFLRSLWPVPNPWPSQAQRYKFFGGPGENLTQINVGGLGVKYEGKPVRLITCHQKVADDLLAIIKETASSPWAWVLADYAGCYANKALMHGLGAAIDFVPDTNGMTSHWPTDQTMPWGVIKIFSKHGWISAGVEWGYDGMHFQATTW